MTDPEGDAAPDGRRERWTPGLVAVAVAAPVVPILVSLVRALHRGWYPVGDNAYFSLRARDVLTHNNPLLGTWTSASLSLGKDVNNPGPLLFDIFALPARINATAGLAVGAALLNVACIVGAALVARRRGGVSRVVVTMAVAAALAWTMGSELLFDPWQPHALVFPFLLYLVLVVNLVQGDIGVLPWAVLLASLLVESHLGYGLMVAGLGLGGVVACLLVRRRDVAAEPSARAGERRALRRPFLLAVVVAGVCWAQPVFEQLTTDDGNLGRVVASSRSSEPRAGLALAARFVAGTSVVPPAWGRPSFDSSLLVPWLRDHDTSGTRELVGAPSARGAVLGLALLASVLIAAGFAAFRRRDRPALAAVVTAAAGLALAVVAIATLPLGVIGPVFVLPHQIRFLWPIGIMAAAAVAHALFGRSRAFVPAVVAVAVAFAVATMPTYLRQVGPSESADAIPVLLEVSSQLRDVTVDGPVLVADADLAGMRPFEPYSTAVMLELVRAGVDVVVDGDSQARQVGEGRHHPERATTRLVIKLGREADDVPAGGRRIAGVAGLTEAEGAELEQLATTLPERLAVDPLVLNDDGEEAVRLGLLPGIGEDGVVDPGSEFALGSLASIVVHDLLDPDDERLADLRRYTELRQRLDRLTIGVYLVPLTGAIGTVP